MTFRRATVADSRLIWEWRNDPVTREMSRSSEEISWEQHQLWFESVSGDPRRSLLIAERGEEPLGVLRFDPFAEGCAEISINVAPSQRGKGISRTMLAAACRYGFEQLSLARIYAEIKETNAPSIKIFEGVGFRFAALREDLRTYFLTPPQLEPTR